MQLESPATPADVLDISGGLRFVMNTVCKSAELFGYWHHPYKNAATCFEEMTLLDKFYWVYKCRQPVVHGEKREHIHQLLQTNKSTVVLPEGFSRQASVTLGAAGDLIQAEGLEHSADRLYENVEDLLFEKDLSYANLESPLTTQALQKEVISDKESPIECCSRAQFDILKGHRGKCFSLMHTAGNHSFDMGVEGIETTRRQFATDGIVGIGINPAPEDYGKGKIILRDGLRIGFVSATYGLNGRNPPEEEVYRINVARMHSRHATPDLDIVRRQIDHCRREGCDFIIASLHWGYEFEFFPRRHQIDMARSLVEYGADAIIAHHPHVIQPVEYYRTQRDPERIAVIAYSLGSLTWAFSAPHLVLSAVLNLTLSKGRYRNGTSTYIESAQVTPVFRSRSIQDGKAVTQIEKLADHLGVHEDPARSAYIDAIARYATLVLGSDWQQRD
jgi:poly-gamma-glutamate synthesis protein (capsule biosynthesis protein)